MIFVCGFLCEGRWVVRWIQTLGLWLTLLLEDRYGAYGGGMTFFAFIGRDSDERSVEVGSLPLRKTSDKVNHMLTFQGKYLIRSDRNWKVTLL